jgi:hypothetical protein
MYNCIMRPVSRFENEDASFTKEQLRMWGSRRLILAKRGEFCLIPYTCPV